MSLPCVKTTLGGVKSETANSNIFSFTFPDESVTDNVISWIPGLVASNSLSVSINGDTSPSTLSIAVI